MSAKLSVSPRAGTSATSHSGQEAQSPFVTQQPVRLTVSMLMLLLLMVVAAGVAMLWAVALRVPVFSMELRALLGMPEAAGDPHVARQAHVVFVIILYTAPLGLGILVYLLHLAVNWLHRPSIASAEDDEMRME